MSFEKVGLEGGGVLSVGMTLRDYFAGQLIAGLLQSTDLETLKPIADKNNITMVQAFGVMAYNYADAMLEARK